ncbi:MAG: hypothetical protein FD180_4735 [Planctomycetota bacterium]|nr:MAG: hypothetical protein FD180_4735 [Planctomycetota bacterium]
MTINSLEDLKQAALSAAEELDAAGEAAAAYRIKDTMAKATGVQGDFIEQLIDALESARRLWLHKAAGAKAFALHKLISAARNLK